MKSFRTYANQTPQTPSEHAAPSEEKQSAATAEELTKRMAAAYNGKSNAEMLRNILAEAEKSKRAGTLTNEEIEFCNTLFIMHANGVNMEPLDCL